MTIAVLCAEEIDGVSGGATSDTAAYSLTLLAAATYWCPPVAAYFAGAGGYIGLLGAISDRPQLDISIYNAMGDFF